MKVDLHKMKVSIVFEQCYKNSTERIKELLVIHGYNNGDSLHRMVCYDYQNKWVTKNFK